jgi:hypothetical protein
VITFRARYHQDFQGVIFDRGQVVWVAGAVEAVFTADTFLDARQRVLRGMERIWGDR